MKRFVRQTLVVARRDFVAIVFTPTFLVFLLAPLLMLGFGAIGGLGAASLADGSESRVRIIAFVDPAVAPRVTAADTALREVFRPNEQPPELDLRSPVADQERVARALFDDEEVEASAVLYGALDRPMILHGPRGERTATYLGALAEQAVRAERSGVDAPLTQPRIEEVAEVATSTDSGREASAFFAVFAIFFVTLLLASQAVGMLAEERGNKVIEVLAAAVPLEAVFLGKLIGLFGVAILFLAFWGVLGTQAIALLPAGIAPLDGIRPAVGLPMFVALFMAYFVLAFLLLSAIFLGIGAQASTMREIQMLSLPITMGQVGMFALSTAAASRPDALVARIAEIFPFSSPFAMAARAANDPALWPHALGLAWQIGWVALTVFLSARLFRIGVLSSGGGLRLPFTRRTPAPAPAEAA